MKFNCVLCKKESDHDLCEEHIVDYTFDRRYNGYFLKKKGRGSRYTKSEFHKTEIRLTKIIEDYYGKKNIITSYHPIWARSRKGVLYEFDIYIINKDILIEFNSEIHYEFVPFFHKTVEKFLEYKKRDKHKAKLAKLNNKKLVIIKYDEPIFKDYIIKKIEKTK